jgi:hypothetical protein
MKPPCMYRCSAGASSSPNVFCHTPTPLHTQYVRHEDVVSPENSLRWLAGFVERHG